MNLTPINLPTYNTNHHIGSKFENNEGEPIVFQSQKVGPGIWYKFIKGGRDYTESIEQRSILNDFNSEEIKVWWIGHATLLIQFGDKFALTDPIFSSYASPVPFIITRKTPPACNISELPPISYVFISHDHWDHLNHSSLIEIQQRNPSVLFFAPLVTSDLISSWVGNCISFDWRQTLILDNLKITCFPARHACNRYGIDFKERLWCSFLFEFNNISIYFPGDTGIGPHFLEIKEYLNKPLDLALMPIGPQEPSNIMRAVHLNPLDAIDMSLIMNSKAFLPIHWGCFGLGMKPEINDIDLLRQNWISGDLFILKVGGCLKWNNYKFEPIENSLL